MQAATGQHGTARDGRLVDRGRETTGREEGRLWAAAEGKSGDQQADQTKTKN